MLAHTPHLALQLLTLLVRTLLFLLFSWENVADLQTKHVPRAVLDKLAGMMGYTFPDAENSKVSRVHEHQSELLGSETGSS